MADLQLYGYTPAKRETVLGCGCRGTEPQICGVRLHSRQKGGTVLKGCRGTEQ